MNRGAATDARLRAAFAQTERPGPVRRRETGRDRSRVHDGRVAIGDVRDLQSLAFAAVGDTVNVSSRLQSLTRDLHVSVVVSQDLIDAVRAEGVFGEQ